MSEEDRQAKRKGWNKAVKYAYGWAKDEPEEEEEEIKESNHLMIEAEDPAAGLAMALDSLKKIHRELGTKHPVAKISGANLSHRGIASVAERLAGKDLVVEHAADLDDLTVEELED